MYSLVELQCAWVRSVPASIKQVVVFPSSWCTARPLSKTKGVRLVTYGRFVVYVFARIEVCSNIFSDWLGHWFVLSTSFHLIESLHVLLLKHV